MTQSLLRNRLLMFMIGTSFFGLSLIIMLAFSPPVIQENFPWRKPTIGIVFEAICVLGIIAIFFPKQCSAMFQSAENTKSSIRFFGNRLFIKEIECDSVSHPCCRLSTLSKAGGLERDSPNGKEATYPVELKTAVREAL